MTTNTATSTSALLANEVGYDPIEDRLRLNIRSTIEAVLEEERWSGFWAAAAIGEEKQLQRATAMDIASGS
jgi:hypothetical protein